MSLFEWFTPERQRAGQVLPIVPNEIYFCILEHVAPTRGRPTIEQLRTLISLSCVCRFFANFCLPRIFEFVEFTSPIPHANTPTNLRNDSTYRILCRTTSCTQTATKKPLSVALAKTVRVCRFAGWIDEEDSAEFNKYIASVPCMSNIRRLEFSSCLVNAEHWDVMATLPVLEELSFDTCRFLRDSTAEDEGEPERRVKVKVPRLCVVRCYAGLREPAVAIDVRYLRALVTDYMFLRQVDWRFSSTLAELFVRSDIRHFHAILMLAPQSLEVLGLAVDVRAGQVQNAVRDMFDDPAWRKLTLLRSLTLQVYNVGHGRTLGVVSSALEGVGLLTSLQSLTLKGRSIISDTTSAQIRQVVHDKLCPASCLEHVDIGSESFRLVDGEWLEVSSSTT